MGEIAAHPTAELRTPERIRSTHDLSRFESNEPELDDWLRKRALQNEGRASRTYVVCSGNVVVGYYALAAGSVLRQSAPPKLRRNSPDPLPVLVLGRLAVAKLWQGQGIGRGMLRDAILRTLHVAEAAGISAILVHAISPQAKQFYEMHDFIPSGLDPMTMMISLKQAQIALGIPFVADQA